MKGIEMYGENALGCQSDNRQELSKQEYQSRTIGQNINARIECLKQEIVRLEGVREQLESGASLLNVRIEDLRQAMNY